MLDLDPYGGTDPLGMFPCFLKRTADVMAPHLSALFRWLVHLGSFPVCWRQANVTLIQKGPPSSFVANYRPISLTSVRSKVFERLVSVRLGRFMECSGVVPATQCAYRKALGSCDALLYLSQTLQSVLESGQEDRILLINFSAAFDRVNHQDNLRAQFLTGSVFECDIAHHRSVAVFCMLYKTRCNLMDPLNGALPGPYEPVRVTGGALVAHRYTYVPPRCRTSQYRWAFVLLSVSILSNLADRVFDGAGLAGFNSRANAFFWHKLLYPYYTLLLFSHLFSFSIYVGIVRLGSSD